MKQNELEDLTNAQLLEEKKKIQYNKLANATFVGICIGVAVYSAINNGFGFFTFFPLILAYPFIKNEKKIKALEKELESRKLK